jgi:hypothetical protein
VELRRVGARRVAQVDDRLERRPRDVHELRRVERLIAGCRDDHRGRLADVTGAIAGERPARRLGHPGAGRAGDAPQRCHRAHAGEIGGGEHRDHAGRGARGGGVDRVDPRVRVRRAHERAVQLAFEPEVGDVAALAGEKTQVFAPAHRRADTLQDAWSP